MAVAAPRIPIPQTVAGNNGGWLKGEWEKEKGAGREGEEGAGAAFQPKDCPSSDMARERSCVLEMMLYRVKSNGLSYKFTLCLLYTS